MYTSLCHIFNLFLQYFFGVLYKKNMLKMHILGSFSEFYKLMQYLLYHKGLVFLQGVCKKELDPSYIFC